jgi:hypothetical protein
MSLSGLRSIDFLQSDELAWSSARLAGVQGALATVRVLRTGEDGSVVAAVLRFRGELVLDGTTPMEWLMLSGCVDVADTSILPGDIYFTHAGVSLTLRAVYREACLLVFRNEEEPRELVGGRDRWSFPESGGVSHLRADRLVWDAPNWRGPDALGGHGLRVAWVRKDDSAVSFLSSIPPGFSTQRPEWHDVPEESFRLSGDLLLGDRGVSRPGGYFFHPAEVNHGPLFSVSGTVSYIRKGGVGTTGYGPELPDADLLQLRRNGYLRLNY